MGRFHGSCAKVLGYVAFAGFNPDINLAGCGLPNCQTQVVRGANKIAGVSVHWADVQVGAGFLLDAVQKFLNELLCGHVLIFLVCVFRYTLHKQPLAMCQAIKTRKMQHVAN